ncbi:MAG: hypothetical protein P8163_16340 [Candidatus Thiodiazotropha sp.]
MKRLTILITTLLAMFTTHTNADDFKVIDFGYINMHRGDSPWVIIINNQLDWETFYEELLEANEIGRLDYCGIGPSDAADCIDPPNIPTVDFESHQVVAGGIGTRPVDERLVISSVQTLSDHRIINVVQLRYTEYEGPTCTISTLENVYTKSFISVGLVVGPVYTNPIGSNRPSSGCQDIQITNYNLSP